MSNARAGRGAGNGGDAYRNSPLWDNLSNKENKEEDVVIEDVPVDITKVYFDMDGVWVDWQIPAMKAWQESTGSSMTMVELNMHKPFHAWVANTYHMDNPIFRTLPAVDDVELLITLIIQLQDAGIEVEFLSATGSDDNTEIMKRHADKTYWVNTLLSPYMSEVPRVLIVGQSSEKYTYTEPHIVLVDDFDNNCKDWINAGGRAVMHKNARQTRYELSLLIPKLKERK